MRRMQVKVLGAERRRRWSYDEKVRLLEEKLQAGETVCGVARRRCVAMWCDAQRRVVERCDAPTRAALPTVMSISPTRLID
jgi:transposase-like protein